MVDLNDIVESMAEIVQYMDITKKLVVCKGTDVEEEWRAPYCMDILDETSMHCRDLRRTLLRRRTAVDVQQQLATAKKSVQLERRKFLRLWQKIAITKENVARLQMECAVVKNTALESAIASLPVAQQQLVVSCFETSKVKCRNKRRYPMEWIYECLLMSIKNSSLYEHIRDRGILPLPCRKTLSWYIQKISSSTYGFQESIFECLRRKGSRMDKSYKRGTSFIRFVHP